MIKGYLTKKVQWVIRIFTAVVVTVIAAVRFFTVSAKDPLRPSSDDVESVQSDQFLEEITYLYRDQNISIYSRDGSASIREGEDITPVLSPPVSPEICIPLDSSRYLLSNSSIVWLWDRSNGEYTQWADLGPNAIITSLELINGSIFVADAGEKLVYRFGIDGALISLFSGVDGKGFSVPSPWFDVAAGADDTVWITNPGKHRVEHYSLEGNFLGAWGNSSNVEGGFSGCCNPADIITTGTGYLITREKGIGRITVFTTGGTYCETLETFGPEEQGIIGGYRMNLVDRRLIFVHNRRIQFLDVPEKYL